MSVNSPTMWNGSLVSFVSCKYFLKFDIILQIQKKLLFICKIINQLLIIFSHLMSDT